MTLRRPRVPLEVDVYTLACERTAHVMETCDRALVMFSGGKDSTAVLNVALDVAHSDPRFARHLPLRVVFQDEEAIPVQTAEYVRRVSRRPDVALEWYCLPFKHRNACSRLAPHWWPWAPESEPLWCRPLPPEGITELAGFPSWPPPARLSSPDANGLFAPPEHGNTALLMGIRAQESMTRYRAVTGRKTDNYIIKLTEGTSRGNVYKAYPIYDWRTEDVWTAPRLRSWDYNAAYDRLEMAGITPAQQRCSPAFGEEPIRRLDIYASCFPEVWEKMVDRVPGVGAAVRYSRTELYGYGERPVKPAGMTFPEFTVRYVSKFNPQAASYVAERVRFWMARHYRKTTDPILPTAPHPDTGVSWDFLLKIAMRGDFKERTQVTLSRDEHGRPHARDWHRYATELQQVISAGTVPDLAHPGRVPSPATVIPPYAREDTAP